MNLEKKRFTFSFTYSDSLLSFYNHYAVALPLNHVQWFSILIMIERKSGCGEESGVF